MAPKYAMGIDLGGTKILAAVVDAQGNVLAAAKKTTQAEKGPEVVIERIQKAMDEALDEAKLKKDRIATIGIGAPGIIDSANGIVISLTNLPGWRNVEIAKQLRRWHPVPVSLSNDVRVAAVGEHRVGAGRGVHSMIAVFVGTGIGGGIILNDKPWVGFRASAGEVGHMVLLADGPYALGGGIRGGIEALASRSAIDRDLRAGLAAGRKSVLPDLLKEKGSDAITSSVLAKAVSKNDPLTLEVLRRAAYYLGLHAASLINAFDPEMLVYGGGVIEGLGEWMVAQIRDVAKQHAINKNDLDKVKIVEAKLGEQAGVIGAALVALDALKAQG
ncbi:MAG: ROK family protein [Thermoflexales bacterium]|nr:ROK family protein [Thermoflexales bacterium]MDW8351544.1 ROK family protein [Anaerolineae bacterium]